MGSEVVLVGGLCGDDGYLITSQKIEWNLSQDSVGQFVDFSDRGSYWNASKKLSADYAITKTSRRSEVVTRGTPSVTDDIVQQKGQCWISLTSASEGTSYVTALAPEGATWPQRRQVRHDLLDRLPMGVSQSGRPCRPGKDTRCPPT